MYMKRLAQCLIQSKLSKNVSNFFIITKVLKNCSHSLESKTLWVFVYKNTHVSRDKLSENNWINN